MQFGKYVSAVIVHEVIYVVIVIFSLLNISNCFTSGQIDYESVSELVTLPAGIFSRVCVDIVIIDNPADENDEVFILNLLNNNNWPQFRNSSQVIIIDDGKLLYISLQQYIQLAVESVERITTVVNPRRASAQRGLL